MNYVINKEEKEKVKEETQEAIREVIDQEFWKSAQEEIANNIIAVLEERAGFDSWWDDLDGDIQKEILTEMEETIETIYKQWKKEN
jgi:hypothetical protein